MCPVCGSDKFDFFFINLHGEWVKVHICLNCGVVYCSRTELKKLLEKSGVHFNTIIKVNRLGIIFELGNIKFWLLIDLLSDESKLSKIKQLDMA